jgi:hypothetical protein
MSNRKTVEERLKDARLEKEQAESRIRKLLEEQKEGERKARTHRFCKRGGLMEKLLPDLALLTDDQFEAFFKRTAANKYGRDALAEIAARNAETPTPPKSDADTAQGVGAADAAPTRPAARTEADAAPKPAQAAHDANGDSRGKPAQALKASDAADGSKAGEAARAAS